MAAKKKAADVAADLKNEQAKETKSTAPALETPAKEGLGKASRYMLQAFGVMNIPVAAYKATEADKLDTHMYHSPECINNLKQSYHCSGCGVKVENAQNTAAKGVEVGDQVIFVTKEEIEKAKPASDKVIKITGFVPENKIDIIFYESTEYLTADDKAKTTNKPFATLQQALVNKKRVAIGTLVSRGHEYTVAIRPDFKNPDGLVMSYLYADYEVRTCTKWAPAVTNPAEVALVEQLMTETELAHDEFTPAKYDTYLANIREVIKKKAAGETTTAYATEEKCEATGTDGLLDLLKATLNQQKAKGAKA